MRYFITFIISLVSFFLLDLYDIDNVFIIVGVCLVIILGVLYPFLKITFLETRLDKIENFLLKNKKNPSLFIIYALANELDDEVRLLTDKLVQKSKNRSRQALYKVIRDLYFKDIEGAKEELPYIKPLTYQLYYEAAVLLEENDIHSANHTIEKISSAWMKNALLAERERKLGHTTEAIQYAKQALHSTKGIQRYSLQKKYQKEFQL